MKIIENSEIMGYKNKNLITALTDRIKLDIKNLEEKRNDNQDLVNSYELLKRYSDNKNQRVWLFVDDIDATFVNTEDNMIVVGTFLLLADIWLIL